MQKIATFSILLFSFYFLSGCTSPEGFNYFDKSPLYKKAIHYTKKADITDKEKVKVLFNATYLNSVDEIWNNEYENFLIGVYTVNDPEFEDFNITLNDLESKEISDFNEEHPMQGNVPLYNPWAKYRIYSFENPDYVRDLSLKLIYPNEEEATLHFEAE
jgi:hypothetical protein